VPSESCSFCQRASLSFKMARRLQLFEWRRGHPHAIEDENDALGGVDTLVSRA
jgi:hypothetical protein